MKATLRALSSIGEDEHFFVRAGQIRALTDAEIGPGCSKRLVFQELYRRDLALLERGGDPEECWLIAREVREADSFEGLYRHSHCTVSHRWEEEDDPDPSGLQLQRLREFLKKHTELRFVWTDWSCMPQDMRTPKQRQEGATHNCAHSSPTPLP